MQGYGIPPGIPSFHNAAHFTPTAQAEKAAIAKRLQQATSAPDDQRLHMQQQQQQQQQQQMLMQPQQQQYLQLHQRRTLQQQASMTPFQTLELKPPVEQPNPLSKAGPAMDIPSLSLNDLALLEMSLEDVLNGSGDFSTEYSDAESQGCLSPSYASDCSMVSPMYSPGEETGASRFPFPSTLEPPSSLSPKSRAKALGSPAAAAAGGQTSPLPSPDGKPRLQMRYKRSVEMRAKRRQADARAGRFNCLVPGCGKHYNSSGGIRYHLRNCKHEGLVHSEESRRQVEEAREKDEASEQRRELAKVRGLSPKKRRPRSMIIVPEDPSASEQDQQVPTARRRPSSLHGLPFTEDHLAKLMFREQNLATTSALYDEFNSQAAPGLSSQRQLFGGLSR